MADGSFYKRRLPRKEERFLTQEDIDRIEKVQAGIALLDRVAPAWRLNPQVMSLDVFLPNKCPCALAFKSYNAARKLLKFNVYQMIAHGFDAEFQREYDLLTKEWFYQLGFPTH